MWKYINNSWESDGPLPYGLQYLKGHFYGPDGEGEPACFGIWWEGVGDNSEQCKECLLVDLCLEKMTKTVFETACRKWGPQCPLEKLAEELQINEQAVLKIIAYKQGLKVRKKKREPIPRAKRYPAVDDVVDGVLLPEGTSAPTVRAPEENRPRVRHGNWANRWKKERARHPNTIGRLEAGLVLERTYKGILHRVEVLNRYYSYRGERYSTLYAVMVAITGLKKRVRNGRTLYLPNWNTHKFWRIDRILEEMEEEAKERSMQERLELSEAMVNPTNREG